MPILVNIISNELYQITKYSPIQIYIYTNTKIIRTNMKNLVLLALYNMYPNEKLLIKNIFNKHIQYVNINRDLKGFINKYDIIIN
jgi:hypothetical protein